MSYVGSKIIKKGVHNRLYYLMQRTEKPKFFGFAV